MAQAVAFSLCGDGAAAMPMRQLAATAQIALAEDLSRHIVPDPYPLAVPEAHRNVRELTQRRLDLYFNFLAQEGDLTAPATWGRIMGAFAVNALAEAVRRPIAYAELRDDVVRHWQEYYPATAHPPGSAATIHLLLVATEKDRGHYIFLEPPAWTYEFSDAASHRAAVEAETARLQSLALASPYPVIQRHMSDLRRVLRCASAPPRWKAPGATASATAVTRHGVDAEFAATDLLAERVTTSARAGTDAAAIVAGWRTLLDGRGEPAPATGRKRVRKLEASSGTGTADTREGSIPKPPEDGDATKRQRKAKKVGGGESTALSTLYKNDDDGDFGGHAGVLERGERAERVHNERNVVICTLCRGEITARTHNIKQHVRTCHAGDTAKQSTVPAAVAAAPLLRERQEAAEIASCKLFAMGLSTRAIDDMASQVLPLLLVSQTLPTRRSMLRSQSGVLHRHAAALANHMADLGRGKPIHLVIDGSQTSFARKQKVVAVVADSALLDAPMLVHARFVNNVSMDADFYADIITSVLQTYRWRKEDVVVVATDNTSVMPAAVRRAGFTALPCVAHVIDLMVEAVCDTLAVTGLFGLRRWLSNSFQRRTALTAVGASPSALLVPEHRFVYMIPALRELEAHWDLYLAHVDSANTGPRPRRRGAPAASDAPSADVTGDDDTNGAEAEARATQRLATAMHHSQARLRVSVCLELIKDAEALVALAESDVRQPASTFWRAWAAYETLRTTTHDGFGDGTVRFVNRVIAGMDCGATLAVAEVAALAEEVKLALEVADEKVLAHMWERRPAGRARALVADLVAPLRRRALWDVATLKNLPRQPTPEQCALMFGPAYAATRCEAQYATFLRALDEDNESFDVKFVPSKPAPFWDALARDERFPLVARAALEALSIPLSSVAAERCFSVLRNREVNNRKLAGVAYASTSMLLACNRHYYEQMTQPRVATLVATVALTPRRSRPPARAALAEDPRKTTPIDGRDPAETSDSGSDGSCSDL